MRFKIWGYLLAAAGILAAGIVAGQSTSVINGVVYADYYYNMQNSVSSEKFRNAFQYRRIYFTYENNLTAAIKVRFRLESEHDKYGSTAKINPFVKHAYLEWANLIPNHSLYFGIQETNGFKNSEEIWGYRSIEKTIMDLNKILSSADMGVGLRGDLNVKTLHHWLTIMNGTGYGASEGDRFKKIGYAFWVTPVNNLILEGYCDFEKQDPGEPQTATVLSSAKDYAGSTGYSTLKGFIGYSLPRLTVGAEVFKRTNKESGIQDVVTAKNGNAYSIVSSKKADVVRSGYSVFGSWILPIPQLKAFLRYDRFDNNTGENVFTRFDSKTGVLTGGKDDGFSMWFAGLDWIPVGNVHFMPNVILKQYEKSGLDNDLTARITLYFKYDSGKIIVP